MAQLTTTTNNKHLGPSHIQSIRLPDYQCRYHGVSERKRSTVVHLLTGKLSSMIWMFYSWLKAEIILFQGGRAAELGALNLILHIQFRSRALKHYRTSLHDGRPTSPFRNPLHSQVASLSTSVFTTVASDKVPALRCLCTAFSSRLWPAVFRIAI